MFGSFSVAQGDLPLIALVGAAVALAVMLLGLLVRSLGTREVRSRTELIKACGKKPRVLQVQFRNTPKTGSGARCWMEPRLQLFVRLNFFQAVELDTTLDRVYGESFEAVEALAWYELGKYLEKVVKALEGSVLLVNGTAPDWLSLRLKLEKLGVIRPEEVGSLMLTSLMGPPTNSAARI